MPNAQRPLMLSVEDLDQMLRHTCSARLRDILLDLRNGERVVDERTHDRTTA